MNEDSEDGIISEDEIILLKPPIKRKKKNHQTMQMSTM